MSRTLTTSMRDALVADTVSDLSTLSAWCLTPVKALLNETCGQACW